MHPHIRKGMMSLMMISGSIFAMLSVITVIGIVLILLNGGRV